MPKKREAFSENNLVQATSAVLNDGLSKNGAAKLLKVKNPGGKTTCGPSSILTADDEKLLDTWILESCKKGFPQHKEDLQLRVKKMFG